MIILSFGSNLNSKFGDRKKTIEFAYRELINNNVRIIKRSKFYKTISYPNKNSPKFINSAACVNTLLDEHKLLSLLLKIEKKAGRVRSTKNAPRTLDIDIIFFNNKIINIKKNNINITIPHKNYSKREFVVVPIFEIAPNFRDPETKINILELKNKLKQSQIDSIRKL